MMGTSLGPLIVSDDYLWRSSIWPLTFGPLGASILFGVRIMAATCRPQAWPRRANFVTFANSIRLVIIHSGRVCSRPLVRLRPPFGPLGEARLVACSLGPRDLSLLIIDGDQDDDDDDDYDHHSSSFHLFATSLRANSS